MAATILNGLLVAIGGAIGALCRYGLCSLPSLVLSQYPHTLVINIIGSVAIGIVWATLNHFNAPREWSLLLITGILGGFTTYSAFSLDTVTMIDTGQYLQAAKYILFSLIGAVGGCALGLYLTRHLLSL